MSISLVVSVLNEESSIALLIDSILNQVKTPDEMIIVDGGSTDNTCNIVRSYIKENKIVKLYEYKTTRSEARNVGINLSKGSIIVTTDSGCVAEKYWIKNISKPFKDKKVDMVAGFYKMVGSKSPINKALSVFIGITPEKFDDRFLASARSLAFRKSLWKKIGGFPEGLKDTAEDTVFNFNAIKSGVKIIRVKNAIVYWKLPETLSEGIKKIYLYAKGDAKSGIWWHPLKKFKTHNIKVLLIILRYLIALYLIKLSFIYKTLQLPVVLGIILYTFWAFRKVYLHTKDIKAGFAGIIVQIFSDIAVMAGFVMGILNI